MCPKVPVTKSEVFHRQAEASTGKGDRFSVDIHSGSDSYRKPIGSYYRVVLQSDRGFPCKVTVVFPAK
jgi:hypothetical protein